MTARGDGERVEPGPIAGMQSEIAVERIDASVGREWTLISVWRSEFNQGQTVELSEAGGVL